MAKSNKKTSKSTRSERVTEPTQTRTRTAVDNPSDDRSLFNRLLIAGLILLGLYMLFGLFSSWRDQQNGEKTSDKDQTSQVKDEKEPSPSNEKAGDGDPKNAQSLPSGTTVSETDASYNFVVGEGESYTTIARYAVASIDSGLTPAERVAAETKLATDANAEWLNVGQNLTLEKSAVKAAVEYAKNLSAEEKAAWQPYADLVAWDTASK